MTQQLQDRTVDINHWLAAADGRQSDHSELLVISEFQNVDDSSLQLLDRVLGFPRRTVDVDHMTCGKTMSRTHGSYIATGNVMESKYIYGWQHKCANLLFDETEILIPDDIPWCIFPSLDKMWNLNSLQKRRIMTLLKQFIKLK